MLTSSRKYSSSSTSPNDATELDGDFYQRVLTDYDQIRTPHKPANHELNKLDLLDSLNPNFTCPICLDLLQNTMVTECLHRFCEGCITQAIYKNKRECPACRKKLISKRNLRPDPNMDALINTIWPDRVEHDRLQAEQANMYKLRQEGVLSVQAIQQKSVVKEADENVQTIKKSVGKKGVKQRQKQQKQATQKRQYALRSGGSVVEEKMVKQVKKTSLTSKNKAEKKSTSPVAVRKRGRPRKTPLPSQMDNANTNASPIAKPMAGKGKMFSPISGNDSGFGAGTSSADCTWAAKLPAVKTLEEELFEDFLSEESSEEEDWSSEEESSTDADEFHTTDSDIMELDVQARAEKQQHGRESLLNVFNTTNANGVTADDFLSGDEQQQPPFLSTAHSSNLDHDYWDLYGNGSSPPAKRNKTTTGNNSVTTAMKLRQLDGRLPEVIRKRSQEQLKRKSQQQHEEQLDHGRQPLHSAISALNLCEKEGDSAASLSSSFYSPSRANDRRFPQLPNKRSFAEMEKQKMSRGLLLAHCGVPLNLITVQLRQLPVQMGGRPTTTNNNNVYQVKLPHKATIGELHTVFTDPNTHPYKDVASTSRGKLPEVHLLIQSPSKQLIELYGRDTICTVLGLAERANFFEYPTIFFTTKEG